MMQLRDAEAWAREGNVAVHHTGFPYRHWNFTCHLFAQDTEALRSAAASVGCNLKWIQYPGQRDREHYDIFGGPLKKALVNCGLPAEFVPPEDD